MQNTIFSKDYVDSTDFNYVKLDYRFNVEVCRNVINVKFQFVQKVQNFKRPGKAYELSYINHSNNCS